MLVVLEGLDFAGKTTICKRLVYDFEATVINGEEYKAVGNPVCDIICKYLYIEQADYSSKKLKNQILKSSEVSDQITYCKKSLESLPPFPKFTLRTKS